MYFMWILEKTTIGHCAPFTDWRYSSNKGGWRNQKNSLLWRFPWAGGSSFW